ncbi:hypothetical protein ABT354_25255 [Streptomyces sp. NPDC000594]|uniref:hypothetical protein n=1 Tax=Streptomyces sp. NPDC000594 TaxID=3154261 RepID=UPI00331768BB
MADTTVDTMNRWIRVAGAVVPLCAGLALALLAALPLAFNGAQQTLGALGRAEVPDGASASLGRGLAMLGAAVLPFAAGTVALLVGRVRQLSGVRVVRLCGRAVLVCALGACVMAMVNAV